MSRKWVPVVLSEVEERTILGNLPKSVGSYENERARALQVLEKFNEKYKGSPPEPQPLYLVMLPMGRVSFSEFAYAWSQAMKAIEMSNGTAVSSDAQSNIVWNQTKARFNRDPNQGKNSFMVGSIGPNSVSIYKIDPSDRTFYSSTRAILQY